MENTGDDFIINHPFFEEAKRQMQLCLDSFGCTPDPRCTPILGDSGCGKSTVAEQFKKSLLEHNNYHSNQIIMIECPSTPTVRSMASEVLLSIGDPLYYKGTEVLMTQRILNFIKELDIRLLIFDEMQNLIDQESDKLSFKAADWLKRLINRSKIPTVVLGLKRAEDLFLINDQLRRRFTEKYEIRPFDWHQTDTKLILKGFLKALQLEYSFVDKLNIFSNEMAFRFYCATGGLVGYIMSIIREAKRLAVGTTESGAIGLNHLAQAYYNVVCGNQLIGVNPFLEKDLERVEAGLSVVKGVCKQKRKDKSKPKDK